MRRLAILAVALAPLAAQAETLTWTWSPRTGQEESALRAGLALHALREGTRNRAEVRQEGRGNLAAILQSGAGNRGLIVQRGDGNSARLTQAGDGNAHAILQAGRGAVADVAQHGGEAGVTVQLGW